MIPCKSPETTLRRNLNLLLIAFTGNFLEIVRLSLEVSILRFREEPAMICSSVSSDLITKIAACNKSEENLVKCFNRSTHRNPFGGWQVSFGVLCFQNLQRNGVNLSKDLQLSVEIGKFSKCCFELLQAIIMVKSLEPELLILRVPLEFQNRSPKRPLTISSKVPVSAINTNVVVVVGFLSLFRVFASCYQGYQIT